ncbi:diphthine--ammonia ligase [Solitalea sp. MAHUQ-68]|uniref:Diphthine--ammonia ligase n=1 Tax=Solitalea agri TaxID=2953739 RepID=A0A9X2F3W3_9SPHI|nr:diphthine--ammonia ligase [Solitalea agri]MCO4293826.1 diphthine--ammonia ligase [Solitalea agri]
MEKAKAALFWSGGKDASFALYKVLKESFLIEVSCLVTTVNAEFRRISMHGVREELLDQQAQSIGIPLKKMYVPANCTNDDYERELLAVFEALKEEGITTIIYGDIFLEDLKRYREQLLDKAGMKGCFPLWKKDTKVLVDDFLANEFRSVTCCIKSELLSKEFVGKEIDSEFLKAIPSTVDPCGENGEFHSFCFDGPIFTKPINFSLGETVYKPYNFKTESEELQQGFWFVDLLPQ